MSSRDVVILSITLLMTIGIGIAPVSITPPGMSADQINGNGGFLAGVASADGSISITVTDGTVEPGNTVTLQATKDGETVKEALVELDPPGSNEPEQQTDSEGTVTITVPDTRILQVAVQTENASGVREFEVGGGTPTSTPDDDEDERRDGDESEETETPPERTPPPDEDNEDGDDNQEDDRESESDRNESASQEFKISVTDGTVERGNTITLRTTLDGEPISGATVQVQPPGPNPETLTTGSDGTTTITVPNASQVFVEVTAEDPQGFGTKQLLADDDREDNGDGENDRDREGDERESNETERPPPEDREGNETEGPPPEGGDGGGEQQQEPESSLDITVVEGTVAKNNEITVEITADGQLQSNATVMVLTPESESELKTGSDARVSMTVPDADQVELVAIKRDRVGQKELLGGDSNGNETERDGSDREQRPPESSQMANVTSFECVENCDGVAMSEISTPTMYFSSGLKGVNVRLMADSDRDLTTAGASTDTRFRLTIEVSPETGTFDPQTLVVIGDDGEIVSQSSGDPTTVTVEFTPTSGAVNFQDVDVEKPGNWPNRQITANTQIQAIGIVNIAEVGSSKMSELKGMWISTDAQTFSTPSYVPPSDNGTGRIEINVAAPHFKTDGQTVNTGNFRAFVPDTVLSEWGVSDPSTLAVSGLAQNGSISITNTDSGAIVSASGFHYSAGSVTISSAPSNSSANGSTNKPPNASFEMSPSNPTVGSSVTFESTASDPDGSIASYTWSIDGEQISTTETVSHTFDQSGEHTVTLTVTDTDGGTDSLQRTVSVDSTNADEGSENNESGSGDNDNLTNTERALKIAGKQDATELTQRDVTEVITLFNRGQSVNGFTITQTDVTVLATLFDRNS